MDDNEIIFVSEESARVAVSGRLSAVGNELSAVSDQLFMVYGFLFLVVGITTCSGTCNQP